MGLRYLPGMLFSLVARAIRGLLRVCVRPLFASCGRNVKFNPFDQFSYKTIHIGEDVYIGAGACFSAKKNLSIGSKVMFGPNVTIMGVITIRPPLGLTCSMLIKRGSVTTSP